MLAPLVKKRERRSFSTLPTVDSFLDHPDDLDLRKEIDFIVKDHLEDDTAPIRSKLVGVYYTVYKKIRQKSLEAGVQAKQDLGADPRLASPLGFYQSLASLDWTNGSKIRTLFVSTVKTRQPKSCFA